MLLKLPKITQNSTGVLEISAFKMVSLLGHPMVIYFRFDLLQ